MADTEDENWDNSADIEVHDSESSLSCQDHLGGQNDQILRECLSVFSTNDYIMEPGVFYMLKRYFKAGGAPEQVIELLSDNYTAIAQTANLLAEWLILAGVDIKEVQEMVERHLKELILKNFDPKKADSVFIRDGESGTNAAQWLAEMASYSPWRKLFYKLAEEYPDCLLLNFTIKHISDAGFQDEITSVSTATHQIEVFSRVLRTSISSYLTKKHTNESLGELVKMVCFGEHTYLYSQLIMYMLSNEVHGGAKIRRLLQEVQKAAFKRGLDVSPITMATSSASAFPRACQALQSMLAGNSLNPADVTLLHKLYSSSDPPPVELLRSPQFLELFVETLFKPGYVLSQDRKLKYLYLLAYASSVVEIWRHGVRKSVNKDEIKSTTQALERAINLCGENKSSKELVADVGAFFQVLRFPVVAVGVIRWVDYTVMEPTYFQLNTDQIPVHLILLDEVCVLHPLLHQRVLDIIINLFECQFDEMDVLVRLDLKKVLLDRMVHLLSQGFVLPVMTYISACWSRQDTDISLIRHFVTEVLEIITPPCSQEFVTLLLPLLENDDITGNLRNGSEGNQISAFISHCKTRIQTA